MFGERRRCPHYLYVLLSPHAPTTNNLKGNALVVGPSSYSFQHDSVQSTLGIWLNKERGNWLCVVEGVDASITYIRLSPPPHQHLTLLKIKSSTIGELHSILKVNTQLITPSCKMPTFILQKRWGISDLCTGWNGKGYVQLKQCNSSVVHGYMGSCRLATIFKDLGNFTQNPSVQNQLFHRQKPVDLHRNFERGWHRVR